MPRRNARPRSRRSDGFTLMEVVIVIAVVALLSAILTPLLAKKMNDSKLARAKNETQVIAAAVADFLKDAGAFPSMNASGQWKQVATLVSGASVPTSNPFSGESWFSGVKDTFDNHLAQNDPMDGGPQYSVAGERQWRGPYVDTVGLDPWGRPYLCNVRAGYSTDASKHRKLVVISAGPDGKFQTDSDAELAMEALGDDVVTVVSVR